MNVLSLVPYRILPARTGGQRSVALFHRYFAKHVRLICVTTRSNDPLLAEEYTMLNMLSDAPLRYVNPFYFFTLRRLIRQHNISHLLVEHPYYGWLGALLKWFCGVQLIVQSQNIEGLRWKTLGKWWWKILWHYEKWTHRQAHYSFFIQEEDRSYALQHFGLLPERSTVVTYGIESERIPSQHEKQAARNQLLQLHAIPPHHHILLFNGAFNYSPNANGLRRIVNDIEPLLSRQQDFHYTILICGSHIPAGLSSLPNPRIIFAGFVPDISIYFMGADVFLNPVVEGGGIKTKLVEALAHNMNAVSSQNGAIGVDPALCHGKLMITDDTLSGFVEKIVNAAGYRADMPSSFFDHFYWGHVAARATAFIANYNTL